MIKRNWKGDPVCYFCHHNEDMNHLMFTCPVARIIWAIVAKGFCADNIPNSFAQSWRWYEHWIPNGKKFYDVGIAAICWAIWKIRNKVCFEGKKLNNPAEIMCHACALITFWAGLYKEEDKKVLIEGADTMLKIALKILSKKSEAADQPNLLTGPAEDTEDDQNSTP